MMSDIGRGGPIFVDADTRGSTDRSVELPTILARNLKRLRMRSGYSLDRLAQLSGVSRAMIGQIESAKSVPTVGLLARVAQALDVELANLVTTPHSAGHLVLRRDGARVLESSGGKFRLRTLLGASGPDGTGFHEARIAPLHTEELEPYSPGTRANVVVAHGTLAVADGGKLHVTLNEGDALQFNADTPHSYRNPARTETVFYLVTSLS